MYVRRLAWSWRAPLLLNAEALIKTFFSEAAVEDAVRESTAPFEQALQASRRALIWAAAFSMVLNILQLTVPLYMMQVLDRVASSGNFDSLYLLTVIAVTAVVVSFLLDVVRSFVLNRAASWIETKLSVDLFPKVALAYHDSRPQEAGALEDLWRLRSFLSSPAILSIFDAPWMIFYLAILYMLAVPIGVLATIGGVLLLLIAIMGERSVRSKLEPSYANTRRTREYLQGIQFGSSEIVAMGMLEVIQRRWVRLNVKALKGQYLSAGRASLNLSLFKHARLMLQLLVLFAGSALALSGEVSIGVVIGSSIIMGRALGPIEQSISSWKQALSSWGAYKNLKDVLAEIPQVQKSVTRPTTPQGFSVRSLFYSFPGKDTAFLQDISFDVKAGEVLALIGPSGSGKSVLSRVIVGNMPVDSGNVRLGDYDLTNFSREEIGPFIGYVGQKSAFIKGTITENISRFRDYSMEDVVEAARRIGAHEFITELPKGYDTEIGGTDGHPISGGQEQRLAIARALCGRPGLLIFDEPNLNLDVDAEALLFRIVREEKRRGTAIIVVSHQQNMIEAADKIALIRQGRVIKQGPRDTVLSWLRSPQPDARARAKVHRPRIEVNPK